MEDLQKKLDAEIEKNKVLQAALEASENTVSELLKANTTLAEENKGYQSINAQLEEVVEKLSAKQPITESKLELLGSKSFELDGVVYDVLFENVTIKNDKGGFVSLNRADIVADAALQALIVASGSSAVKKR